MLNAKKNSKGLQEKRIKCAGEIMMIRGQKKKVLEKSVVDARAEL